MTPNLYFKVTIFCTSNNSRMVEERAIVTTADQYKVVYDLSIGAIFNDLERPITQISRSRQCMTLTMALTEHFRPTMDK